MLRRYANVDCRHCCRHFLSLSPKRLPIHTERSHHKSTAATSIMLRTLTWTNIRSWWPWKRPFLNTRSTRHTWQAKHRRESDGYFCPSLPFGISPHKAGSHSARKRAACNVAARVCGFRRPVPLCVVLWRRRRRRRRGRRWCGHFPVVRCALLLSVLSRMQHVSLSYCSRLFDALTNEHAERWENRSWQSTHPP